MDKKSIIKRIAVLILSIIMVMSIMPIQAFAISYDTYDVSYRTQSGDNRAWVRYGLTDSSAGSFSVVDQGSTVQFRLSLDNGWYLEKWDTWFNGGEDKAWASDPSYNESNPVLGGGCTFFNTYQSGLLTNDKYIFVSHLGSLYGDFRIDAVVRPILTVNAGDGISYQISTNNPLTTDLSSNQVAVVYGNDATVSCSVDEKYIVTSVSGNYGTNYSNNGTVITVSSIVKPATINIHSRLKQQNVSFDANSGEGTMTMQVFDHGVAQALAENVFEKTGYTFAGWNTKADGTGTAYTDKQYATFTPVNDGDSITLYAQWTDCNHAWTDGTCTACGTVCAHSGGAATCTAKAVCTVCGSTYGELSTNTHDWGGWVSNGNGTHMRTCKTDTSHTETEDCTGGTATCTEKGTCSVCGAAYGSTLPHSYNTEEWKFDGTNHWHECACGARSEAEAHSGGAATCTAKAVCTVCGSTYGELSTNAHDWGGWVSNGDGTHIRTCKTDTSHTETDDCTGGTATCTEKGTCSVCGAAYGNTLPHSYNTEEWKFDGTNHWYECACGARSEAEAHSGGTATCRNKAVCSVCGATYGELAAHTYENGKCTGCEEADPNHVPESDNPQTGDNSNMVLWIALFFTSGGALLALTVNNGKRRTYLR